MTAGSPSRGTGRRWCASPIRSANEVCTARSVTTSAASSTARSRPSGRHARCSDPLGARARRGGRDGGLEGVAGLIAGSNFNCALLGVGSVHCWGANGHGQLGDGTTTRRPSEERRARSLYRAWLHLK
ncbi:MAG: hypothetical protein KF782_22540 [Labilithrix sp.]|nr:hypothetical protein [Labilithrix sp.]